jgi:pyruvate dehydrogenase phosphatase
MPTLDEARRKFVTLCKGTTFKEHGVHTVTFQPLLSKVNQDRVVTETWDIAGQTWLFLAVCDGDF